MLLGANVRYIGRQDAHDKRYNSYRRQVSLLDSLALKSSVDYYRFNMYPRDEYFRTYRTFNPVIGPICTSLIIAMISGSIEKLIAS
jgi:hypothetical protein